MRRLHVDVNLSKLWEIVKDREALACTPEATEV